MLAAEADYDLDLDHPLQGWRRSSDIQVAKEKKKTLLALRRGPGTSMRDAPVAAMREAAMLADPDAATSADAGADPAKKFSWIERFGKFFTPDRLVQEELRLRRMDCDYRRSAHKKKKRKDRMSRKRSRMPKRPHGRRGPKDAKRKIPR